MNLKAKVGEAALGWVKDGMKLGIGTGSTAEAFIHALGGAVANGLDIIGVPTSQRTAELCRELNIPLTTLDEIVSLDLTIDGADEIDPQLSLIKGAGGALLREKIVAMASKKMLVIADGSKLVDRLGAFALPIEVLPFALGATLKAIESLAHELGLSNSMEIRGGTNPFITDGGHFIVDASFGLIPQSKHLAEKLNQIPGVMDHGLFIGIANNALVAQADRVEILSAG